MAQKAKKDRARSNTAALRNLHIGAAVANGLFLGFHFFIGSRSLLAYTLVSVPGFLCQLLLERAGRPKFESSGALRSAGEDLASPGLTEYMFDIIWVTWATLVLVMLFGNSMWFFWLIIPAFGAYKGFGLLGAAKNMASLQGMDPSGAQQQPAGNRKQRRAA